MCSVVPPSARSSPTRTHALFLLLFPLQTDEDPITSPDILSFLRREYGPDATDAVIFRSDRPAIEAMAALKHFLQWFKEGFPYYKSACLHCGNLEHNSMIGKFIALYGLLISSTASLSLRPLLTVFVNFMYV